jgi:hypothetical protein
VVNRRRLDGYGFDDVPTPMPQWYRCHWEIEPVFLHSTVQPCSTGFGAYCSRENYANELGYLWCACLIRTVPFRLRLLPYEQANLICYKPDIPITPTNAFRRVGAKRKLYPRQAATPKPTNRQPPGVVELMVENDAAKELGATQSAKKGLNTQRTSAKYPRSSKWRFTVSKMRSGHWFHQLQFGTVRR